MIGATNIKRALSRRKHKSIKYLLEKTIGKANLNSSVEGTTSPLLLLEKAAQHLSLTEENLLIQISEKTKVDVIFSVAPVTALEIYNAYPESLWRSLAAVPVARGADIAIACVDPILIADSQFSNLDFYIAALKEIESLLGLLIERPSDTPVVGAVTPLGEPEQELAPNNANNLSLAREAVSLMLQEVKSHGAKSLLISLSDKPAYQFTDQQGRRAKGSINPRIVESIEFLLSSPFASKDIGSVVSKTEQGFILETESQSANSVSQSGTTSDLASCNVGGAQKENPKILIVDDDSLFLDVTERYFRREGLSILRSSNAKAALRLLEAGERPRAIVCDLNMPDMGGEDLLCKVRQSSQFGHLPFVILTSASEVENEIRMLAMGADGFASKADDARLLYLKVKRFLGAD